MSDTPDQPNLDSPPLRRCAELLGVPLAGVEFPGGRRRAACRLLLADGRRVVAARRDPDMAGREARVLEALGAQGAPVPRLLAFDGEFLIQSDLGSRRLAQALDTTPETAESALDAAVLSLARLHAAGSAAGLDEAVPPLGTEPGPWLDGLFERPRVFSDGLGLRCPELPLARIEALYTVPRPRFVKWDARPGNAMVGENGAVAWFDFADCCCRRRLDDLGWLLGDEFTPDLPEAEERLLARHLPAFADDLDPAAARLYLRVFGVFHSLCRLGLILDDAFEHGWRDWARCLEGDKVGTTREAAVRVCCRAGRWARAAEPVASLADWLADVEAALPPPRERPAVA